MSLRDIVVVEEQAVALDAPLPLAVRIVCGRGENAFRRAVHRELQPQIEHLQLVVSLLADRQALVSEHRIDLIVCARRVVIFATSLIGAHPHVAVIVVFLAASGKQRHAGGHHRNQESTCFHVLFL